MHVHRLLGHPYFTTRTSGCCWGCPCYCTLVGSTYGRMEEEESQLDTEVFRRTNTSARVPSTLPLDPAACTTRTNVLDAARSCRTHEVHKTGSTRLDSSDRNVLPTACTTPPRYVHGKLTNSNTRIHTHGPVATDLALTCYSRSPRTWAWLLLTVASFCVDKF